jgi:hypothetical protein
VTVVAFTLAVVLALVTAVALLLAVRLAVWRRRYQDLAETLTSDSADAQLAFLHEHSHQIDLVNYDRSTSRYFTVTLDGAYLKSASLRDLAVRGVAIRSAIQPGD